MANPFGKGLASPLRFQAGAGFATVEGEELIRAAMRQILGTEPGELPWRPDFGVALRSRLHKNLDEATRALIAHDIAVAIRKWEPRVEILETKFVTEGTAVHVYLTWRVRPEQVPPPGVTLSPVTTDITV